MFLRKLTSVFLLFRLGRILLWGFVGLNNPVLLKLLLKPFLPLFLLLLKFFAFLGVERGEWTN